MAEYIEREAAVMKIREWFWSAPGVHPKLDRDAAEEIMFAIPAADVVARDCYDRLLAENDRLRKERPVVRCGECKYRQYDALFHQSYCNGNRVTDDWYCADGERSTNFGARMKGDEE